MSKSFQEILNQIAADDTLHTSLLYNLSKITEDSLEIFRDVWPTIPVERRRPIVQELMEITEVNFEVDFIPIFLLTMADSDAQVRATAVKALWEYENPTLMVPLIHLLKTDESPLVRAATATALGKFIYLRELEEVDWNEAMLAEEALLEVIYKSSEDVDVRRRAIESIGFSGESNVTKIIENAYYNDNQKVRVSAIFAMGRNADARWIPWVIKELDNDEAELRFEAVRACGELEAKDAVDKLIVFIEEDDDLEVQEMAIWALGRIGGDKARAVLQICVDGNDEVLAAAAEASLDELNLFGDSGMMLYDFEDDAELDDEFIELFNDDLGGGFFDTDKTNGKDYIH